MIISGSKSHPIVKEVFHSLVLCQFTYSPCGRVFSSSPQSTSVLLLSSYLLSVVVTQSFLYFLWYLYKEGFCMRESVCNCVIVNTLVVNDLIVLSSSRDFSSNHVALKPLVLLQSSKQKIITDKQTVIICLFCFFRNIKLKMLLEIASYSFLKSSMGYSNVTVS